MKLTGKQGKLRIYDSSAILHGQVPLDNETVDMVKFDGITTYTNITTDIEADDAAFSSAFLTDLNDAVFIGSTSVFSMVQFLKDAGTNYAAGSGALKAYYYDGTDFSTVLTGVSDGTVSGGDCFAQDGNISFKIPDNWATGGLGALDSDKYYIKLMTTTSATTAPDADVLCPVDGQYFEVAFAGMDFSGPLGRSKTEEILVLNRGSSDINAHYIEGSDDKIFEPLDVSFSCLLDDTVNKDDIFVVLSCGNPDSSRWSATGVTSKATTKNDGTNFNPTFKDTTKKTVNIQMIFEGSTKNIGYAFYEVFYPEENQTISEAEDGVTLTTVGGCYGVIEKIHGFGVRY
jgi:hypothetical protein